MSTLARWYLLSSQSDRRLLDLARDGDARAFEVLVRRYRRQLLSHCRTIVRGDPAEDALQQGLLGAWLALRNGTEVRDARAWLFAVVHHAALRIARRTPTDDIELIDVPSRSGGPEELFARRDELQAALRAVAALPDQQRAVLLQSAVSGRSYETIAAELELSEGAVRGLLYRARTALRATVTAITPAPLILWARSAGSSGGLASGQGGTGATGAASAGAGGVLLKASAALVAASAAAAGFGFAHAAHNDRARHRRAPRAAAAHRVSVAQAGIVNSNMLVRAVSPTVSGSNRTRVGGVGAAPTSQHPTATPHVAGRRARTVQPPRPTGVASPGGGSAPPPAGTATGAGPTGTGAGGAGVAAVPGGVNAPPSAGPRHGHSDATATTSETTTTGTTTETSTQDTTTETQTTGTTTETSGDNTKSETTTSDAATSRS